MIKENCFMSEDFNIEDFKHIFSSEHFVLPVRWDGINYAATLKEIYDCYNTAIFNCSLMNKSIYDLRPYIQEICDTILRTLKAYLNGKPSEAFLIFNKLFKEKLMANQFSIYDNTYDPSILQSNIKNKRSGLYRTRKVSDNRTYERKDVFHTPFNLRNKVATTRYSIAGYPSLYLSTSLELCLEELDYEINPGRYICSRFEMSLNNPARIIELGIKPTDFFLDYNKVLTKRQRLFHSVLSNNYKSSTLKNYYVWFPLIIACSFIRINRSDPFGVEYVIPQLLMQSVRSYDSDKSFLGVRFFSCSSEYSSELGFNYVFPTNYDNKEEKYCPILSKAFLLTNPVFLNEYEDVLSCQEALNEADTEMIRM